MLRRLAACLLVLAALATFASPAQAGNKGLFNCIMRPLGLGWSEGYHAKSSGQYYFAPAWYGEPMPESLPPGTPIPAR